ncbi:MAG TPA: 2-phosphosulfolactate phosphatase [Longimicrobiales bacterium]|nr:2-phosphosulfolactate phosphatase [Longimicrobiales bacterium]
MRVDVAFTPAEVKGAVGRRTVVVIDVLRATSTMVEALVNGARAILPVGGVDDAVRKAEEIGRDNVLLCGERGGEAIRGFHLGNSPVEFTRERVAGKTLVMTTTNGTNAVLAGAAGSTCLVGSLLNARAVAQRLVELESDALLLCAGREAHFALEDAICAGRIARMLRELAGAVSGNDALHAALRLSRSAPSARTLARTEGGRLLESIGRREDIVFCAREDRYDVVPVLDEHRIRL